MLSTQIHSYQQLFLYSPFPSSPSHSAWGRENKKEQDWDIWQSNSQYGRTATTLLILPAALIFKYVCPRM